MRLTNCFISFLKNFILYWSIASLQCCDGFRWTAEGLSHIYIYTHTCILSPLNSAPTQAAHNIEQSSLCYTVGLFWLSIFNRAGTMTFEAAFSKVRERFSFCLVFLRGSPLDPNYHILRKLITHGKNPCVGILATNSAESQHQPNMSNGVFRWFQPPAFMPFPLTPRGAEMTCLTKLLLNFRAK